MDEADVIIYDALISAEILSLIPDGKEWIYVGKRSGHHCVRQEEINQILLREAKAGKKMCIRDRDHTGSSFLLCGSGKTGSEPCGEPGRTACHPCVL